VLGMGFSVTKLICPLWTIGSIRQALNLSL
jgi:hypothetical protein